MPPHYTTTQAVRPAKASSSSAEKLLRWCVRYILALIKTLVRQRGK